MAEAIARLLEEADGFSQERTQWPLQKIMEREIDPVTRKPSTVKLLHDYWREKRIHSLAPAASFDPKGAMTPDEFRFVTWVDVTPNDPLDFLLRHHPGVLFGDYSGKRLRDYHNANHGRNCALEYLTCKVIKQPVYYEIKQTIGDSWRHYTRLLLPVADRDHNVRRLYYAVNLIDYLVPDR